MIPTSNLQPLKWEAGVEGIYDNARWLREKASELFGAGPGDRIFLVPGIAMGLKLVFCQLGLKTLVITDKEYYDRHHFATLKVRKLPLERLQHRIPAGSDAVYASVVSWQGELVANGKVFTQLRRLANKPLLLADYVHGGAAGFPLISALNADIVVGDLAKWVVPVGAEQDVAFIWVRSASLYRKLEPQFRPMFMATPAAPDPMSVRWMDPNNLKTLRDTLEHGRVTRQHLLAIYETRLQTAKDLAAELGLPQPDTCTLWFSDKRRLDERSLRRWRTRGVRFQHISQLSAYRAQAR